MKEKITDKIRRELKVAHIEVTDDSHRHRGHAEWQPGGETHFTVVVVSDDFASLTRMERHRMVYRILEEELQGGVHALAIRAYTVEEFKGWL